MKIGKRELSLKTFQRKDHYRALLNIFRYCVHPFNFINRYLLGRGKYPCTISVRTPIGIVTPTVFSYYDALTVNVVFFRNDYAATKDIRVVVDIGSNIGISALYFLTRNPEVKCYLFEPVTRNVERLQKNLAVFKERIELQEKAVYIHNNPMTFGVEESGVFGGLHVSGQKKIQVNCININDVLENVLKIHTEIDILKIDIEGDEVTVVKNIDQKFLKKIKCIYFESDETILKDTDPKIFPEFFTETKYGTIYTMTSRS